MIVEVHGYPRSGTTLTQQLVRAIQGKVVLTRKSHRPLKQLVPNDQHKHLAVIRDPRQVCVSGWKFPAIGRTDTLGAFVYQFKEYGFLTYGTWWDHTASLLQHQGGTNFRLIYFEDLVVNLPTVAAEVAAFIGAEMNESTLVRVLQWCSFDHMKKYAKDFGFDGHVIRNGRLDEWKEVLRPHEVEGIDEITVARFPYLSRRWMIP